jgi:hypothetical protein
MHRPDRFHVRVDQIVAIDGGISGTLTPFLAQLLTRDL